MESIACQHIFLCAERKNNMRSKSNNMSERMKMVRDALGLTQKQLADLLDVSVPAIQSYELAKSMPGGKILKRLADEGFNINWILTGEGEMKTTSCSLLTVKDLDLFEATANAVDSHFSATKTPISHDARATLIFILFKEVQKRNAEPNRDLIGGIFSNLLTRELIR